MRATKVAAALAFAAGGFEAQAQQDSPFQRTVPAPQAPRAAPVSPPPTAAPRPQQPQPAPRQAAPPAAHDHGGYAQGGHHSHAHAPYGNGYGYGYGYEGVNVAGPGYGFTYYNGPAYGGLPIGPPVYAYPPPIYGPTFGYGSAYYPPVPTFYDRGLIEYQAESDWNALAAKAADLAARNQGDPTPGPGAVPVPSSREAKVKSLRLQAQGDDAFRNQEYARAADRYRQAFTAAKDDGSAFFRMGYALVAAGRFDSAVEHFRRGLSVEPSLVVSGVTPTELYGPDQNLAWATHLGRATRWVAEDVRDANRVFLLGLLLYYDGDPRAQEFLTKAWQLSGGTEAVIPRLLNPPKVVGADVASQPEAAPAERPPAQIDSSPASADASPKEGPLLALPEIPTPENEVELPNRRPEGEAPLFPLPSEQTPPASDDSDAPPLPPPAEAASGGPGL